MSRIIVTKTLTSINKVRKINLVLKDEFMINLIIYSEILCGPYWLDQQASQHHRLSFTMWKKLKHGFYVYSPPLYLYQIQLVLR